MSKTIELIVAPDGTSRIETKNFTGADCQQASRFLEAALGSRTREQLTVDFYKATSQSAAVQQANGPG